MRKPMAVTPQKLAANRRNAQKSTGPNTANGKAVSKLNALKHGLLAETVVVRGHKIKESTNEFKKLCREFYADRNPVGLLEETLVDQIIQVAWRLRRARTAESGEIALSVDAGWRKRSRFNPQLQWAQWEVWGDPAWAMGDSAVGNSILAGWLRQVRARVEQEGELTGDAIKIPFHGKPNTLSEELEKLRQNNSPPPGEDAAGQREERKKQLLSQLDRKLRDLEWVMDDCRQRERAEEQAHQLAAVLPSEETLDKILRYETALLRQLNQAMNQLERLQRRRQGEAVPPPLTLDVSAKG